MADNKFTRKEIESRNSRKDAVLIIDNIVYNVTEFLEDHPGGIEVLLDNAGKDASECFHDVGHSQDAKDWMKSFMIGEVVEEDKREVRKRETEWQSFDEGDTLVGLLYAWAPPVALSIIAVVLYMYLFG